MREKLFTLRPLKGITVTMFEIGYDSRGAAKVEVVVSQNGKQVFGPDADGMRLFGALSPMHTSDGNEARAYALSYAAMRPGDTDADFFSDYTEKQLAWVDRYSDHLKSEAEMRYGDY